MISGWILLRFSIAFDKILMIFDALEPGLKFVDFHGYPWGGAQIQSTHPGRGDLNGGWVPHKHLAMLIQS